MRPVQKRPVIRTGAVILATVLAMLLAVGVADCVMPAGVGATPAEDPADTSTTQPAIIDPQAAWEAVEQARGLAREDRHTDATARYLAALAYDARLVPLVADELAYQKLWREDASKAAFYFRRYLARHPGQDNREARKGLALAYSWSGRQREAVAQYRDLVAEDPDDGGSRLGLARALLWNNELREGFTTLRGVETDFAGDTPAGRESRRFALRVLDGYIPELDVRLAASWDSDGLDIYRLSADGSWTAFGNILLRAMPALITYHQPDRPDVTAPRLGAGVVAPLSHNWNLNAYGWLQRFSGGETAPGQEKLAWNRPGGDFWLTWIATPRLRIDGGGALMPVETMNAIYDETYFSMANLSFDWRLSRHFLLGASGQLADYSDDNRKSYGSARLAWRREGRLECSLGLVYTYLDFKDPYTGNYWSPDWMRNGSVELRLASRLSRWALRLDGRVGQEKELGSNTTTVGSANGHVGFRISGRALLAANGGYSRSRFTTASGYNVIFASLALRLFY